MQPTPHTLAFTIEVVPVSSDKNNLQITLVTTMSELHDSLLVRRAVFIEEQGVPEHEEIDDHDGDPSQVSSAVHVLGRIQGRPVATGRLLLNYPHDESIHLGRVAILPELRRKGYGRAVMEYLHAEARRHNRNGITLAAQLHAIPFYERLGYVARGEIFLDAGIEHRWMDIEL